MSNKRLRVIIFLLGGALALAGCAKEVAEEAPTPPGEELEPAVEEVVVEEAAVAEEAPVEPMVVPQEEPKDVEQAPVEVSRLDSATYLYMIRHNDYLINIADKEYGDPSAWRQIYVWNRERIGDNPNLIYPYNELELYKPEEEIVEWGYEYIIHTVQEGETLWSIAGDEYGDQIAWSVVLWDNEELLNYNPEMVKPGMELRIRTALWPSY